MMVPPLSDLDALSLDWFNNCRLLEPIANIPPVEAEANFYAALEQSDMAA